MMIHMSQIRDFRRVSGQSVPTQLSLDTDETALALAMVDRQVGEFTEALYGADETQAVTEYGHLLFLVLNLAVAMGLQYPGDVLGAVIESNNTRLVDKRFGDDGRLLKGPGFVAAEPSIRAMLVTSGDIKG